MALLGWGQVSQRLAVLARRLVLAGLAVGLAACSTSVSPSPSPGWPPVGVWNETSVAVTLVVNGSDTAVIQAGALVWPVAAGFPARPWKLQVHSPSGRTLVTLDVAAGPVVTGQYGDADLSCGRLWVWTSGPPPGGGPADMAPGTAPCD